MSGRSNGRSGGRSSGRASGRTAGNGARSKAAAAEVAAPEVEAPEAVPADEPAPEAEATDVALAIEADAGTGTDPAPAADTAVAPRRRGRGRSGGDGPIGPRRAAKQSVWSRLYHGETNIDFVGRKRVWFTISLVAVLISLLSLATQGLKLGIDFKGGAVFEVPAGQASVADARNAMGKLGLNQARVLELSSDSGKRLQIKTDTLAPAKSEQVTQSLAKLTGSPVAQVDRNEVGPSWGKEISRKAVRALIVFLILVTVYIALRFELKMAIPTLVALVHDVIITVGVYSLSRLEVTPATVIAVLTILGYSIYDGIVVFDKVDENTRLVSSTGGLSYSGMVDVSLNQTLMRSLNTTMTALLPVLSLLVVGSWIMGAAVLEEFALALLIGLFAGAYSSIFIASPLLAVLKEREPRYRDIRRRIDARGGDAAVVAATIAHRPTVSGRAAATVAAGAGTGEGGTGVKPGTTVAASGRAIPPRPRKKTKGGRR